MTEPMLGSFRSSDPDTSRQAAIANYPRSGTQREKILKLHRLSPNGLTDFEVSRRMGIFRNVVATRRRELVEAGWIEATDAQRDTDNGTPAIVYAMTEAGLAAMPRPDHDPDIPTTQFDHSLPLVTKLRNLASIYGARAVVKTASDLWPQSETTNTEGTS